MPVAIKDIKPEKRFFGLFVGESGSGKSSAGASFPKKFISLDFDLRARGIRGSVDQGFISGDDVFVEEFPPRKGYGPFEKFLEMQLAMWRSTGKPPYATYQISSLFTFSRMIKNTSHELQGGKILGDKASGLKIRVDGPADFNIEISVTHQFFDYFRMLPANVILDGHLVDKWGKYRLDDSGKPIDMWGKKMDEEDVKALQYAPNVIIGKRLNVRPEYGTTVESYFDNVFEFEKVNTRDGKVVHIVRFVSDIAKNTYGLKGEHDWTGQDFYKFFTRLTGWSAEV